ncbi:DUF5919 domain-containing protein [Nocardia abscessus]|uniref:DUF5919 domain-containing protein n=1 Tax=Nocardia abscessus TaxID=120957 RepID=UPI003980E76E
MIRAQKRHATQQAQPIQIRTYDETVRFNITIVDSAICIIQPYLPRARGVESPTLVARNQSRQGSSTLSPRSSKQCGPAPGRFRRYDSESRQAARDCPVGSRRRRRTSPHRRSGKHPDQR